jgi:hypothetical protein
MISPPPPKKSLESEQPEQSDFEKISCKIHTLNKGQFFKSYRNLCIFFGFEPTGGNRKKSILAKLSNHCTLEKKKNSYTVIKVFDSPLPRIDEKFLKSKYYPMCSYLLLVFLAERYNQDEDERYCYLTKREIMGIISICNEYYSDAYSNAKLIEEESNKDSESEYFMEVALSYLYKLTQRILNSLQRRNFLTFDEVTMVKYVSKQAHEATDEEARLLNEYNSVIIEKYSLKSINAIRLRKDKKEIYRDIERYLGFKHYKAIRFNLAADLAGNAEYLRSVANLTEHCGHEVNSLVCSKLSSLVFEGIVKIRESEPKQLNQKLFIDEFTDELFDEYIANLIAEFMAKGASITPDKFIKNGASIRMMML